MKNIKRILMLPAITCIMLSGCRQPDTSISTTIEVPVSVLEVGTSTIEEFINTTGTVYPMKEVTLSSEMSGKYFLQKNPQTGKPYALGDWAKEGAVLIKFEDEEYYNDLRLKSKEVDYEVSKQEYDKQKSLYDKGGATLRELKNAEITLLNTEYDITSSNLALEKMSVKAPFSGYISALPYFTPGTRVNSGVEMVTVIDYSSLYLETSLPEKYYGNIERGYRVYVTSYTRSTDTLTGTITQISPQIDPDARTFQCFVQVDNKDRFLLPGMFVKADMVVNSAKDVIVIPKDIIINRNRSEIVYVVDNGVAYERYITTGLQNQTSIEVKTGLEAGENVVSKGFETLRNESKVKILR